MLSQARQKFIRSLEQKKFRQEYGVFLAEGNKCCSDLLDLLPCRMLVATNEWLESHPDVKASEIISSDKDGIRKASLLKNPQEVLAVFETPSHSLEEEAIAGQLTLALDCVQDPGNLGTILRIADWFGIKNVLFSQGTADPFNPKTVQATMGAIGRIHMHFIDLEDFLQKTSLPVYGTFLDGSILYETALSPEGIVVMGNEGNGISAGVEKFVSNKLFIPDFPLGKTGSESLNVAVATAVVVSEFRRQQNF